MRKWIHSTGKGDDREMVWRERRGIESFTEKVTAKIIKYEQERAAWASRMIEPHERQRVASTLEECVSFSFLNLGTKGMCELHSLQLFPFHLKQITTALQANF